MCLQYSRNGHHFTLTAGSTVSAASAFADLNEHVVALPRAAACLRGNENIAAVIFCIGCDKAEAALGCQICACNTAEMGSLCQTVFLIFHDLTALGQALHTGFKFLLADAGQQAAQLFDAHGAREQFKNFTVKLLHENPPFKEGRGAESDFIIRRLQSI